MRGHRPHHGWAWTFVILVIAALLAAAFPHFYQGVAQTARTRWPLALLLGFVMLVCWPLAAVFAAITLIGIPLALAMIAFYLALLLVGYVSAGIALGQVALQHWGGEHATNTGWRIAAAVLAMLAISLLGRVPFAGGLIVLVALLTGIGALLMQLRSAPAASAAPKV